MTKCEYCGKEVLYPFKCSFCGFYFCAEHRLPENHDCPNLPARTPLGQWKAKLPRTPKEKVKERIEEEGELHFIKERSPSTKLKTPKPHPKRGKRKFAIIGATVIGVLVALVLLFHYFPITEKDKNIIFSNIPFEEDFHLSKGFLQTDSMEYYFNISLATEFEVDITSDEPINFKLYNFETNSTKIDRKWVQIVYDSVVVKRGVWVVSIAPSNSNANGRIKMTTRTPLLTYMYVHMSATREVGGSNITMNYEDEMEETISVYLSIKLQDFTVVWNYTENGEERNKFTVTWSGASKYQHYVVEITADHRVFGNLTYRILTYGQLTP